MSLARFRHHWGGYKSYNVHRHHPPPCGPVSISTALFTKEWPREIVTRAIQAEDFSVKLLFVSFIWLPVLAARILLLLAGIAATAALLFLARTLGLIALLLLALFLLVALLGRLVLAHLIVVTIHENLPCAP